jgi:hypothetical protein
VIRAANSRRVIPDVERSGITWAIISAAAGAVLKSVAC